VGNLEWYRDWINEEEEVFRVDEPKLPGKPKVD
jgi:hypothetical protein